MNYQNYKNARQLSKRIHDYGLSQTCLAVAIGIPRGTLAAQLSGAAPMPDKTKIMIDHVLAYPVLATSHMKPFLLKITDISGRKKVIDFTDGDVTLEQHEDRVFVQLDDDGDKFLVPGDWEQLQNKIDKAKLPVHLLDPKHTGGKIIYCVGIKRNT
jgi:hypothetical protein